MPIDTARNTAINLDRQYTWMSNLKESQMATALNNFTPENMLRLVRLAMPNLIRSKLFTEVALETTKDSIQYVRPYFSKTASGHDLNDREGTYGTDTASNDDYDPWDYSKGGDFNGDDFRKALFEDTRDRANQELANVLTSGDIGGEVQLYFKALSDDDITTLLGSASDTAKENAKFLSQKWGTDGANYVDGYVTIYGYNEGDSGEAVERQLIA